MVVVYREHWSIHILKHTDTHIKNGAQGAATGMKRNRDKRSILLKVIYYKINGHDS